MVRILLAVTALLAGAPGAAGQLPEEWLQQKQTQKKYLIEQIAAVRTYGQILQEGYAVARQGLSLWGRISGRDQSQHQDHYARQAAINPAVPVPALSALVTPAAEPRLPLRQSAYLRAVDAQLRRQADQLMQEAQALATASHYTLSDQARWRRRQALLNEWRSLRAAHRALWLDAQGLGRQQSRSRLVLTHQRRWYNP